MLLSTRKVSLSLTRSFSDRLNVDVYVVHTLLAPVSVHVSKRSQLLLPVVFYYQTYFWTTLCSIMGWVIVHPRLAQIHLSLHSHVLNTYLELFTTCSQMFCVSSCMILWSKVHTLVKLHQRRAMAKVSFSHVNFRHLFSKGCSSFRIPLDTGG